LKTNLYNATYLKEIKGEWRLVGEKHMKSMYAGQLPRKLTS